MVTLQDLKNKLMHEKILKGNSLKNISLELGLSSSYISKFIDFIENMKDSHEIKFDILLRIIRRYYSDSKDIIDIVVDYAKYANKPQNLRMLLEFADEVQDYTFLLSLIEKSKNTSNRSLNATAAIYELLYKRKTSKINVTEYREQLAIHKLDDYSENTFLILILESYLLYDFRAYRVLNSNLDLLDDLFYHMSCDEYIQNRYYERKEEIKMRYLLISNQVDECREVANSILAKTKNNKLIASSYYTLGMSHIFSSFDKCELYLKKASELYHKMDNKSFYIVENYRNFARCYYNRTLLDFDYLSELDEIFFFIKQGKKDDAKKKLEEIKASNTILDYQKPYVIFLHGLINEDKDLFWKSYSEYLKQGEYFFGNLPKSELLKLGISILNS